MINNLHFNGIRIFENPFLPPDFFEIINWLKPEKDAKPIWMNVVFIGDRGYCHTTVYNKIMKLDDGSIRT